jgi:predicted transglutaminase-like cysteine proteinase
MRNFSRIALTLLALGAFSPTANAFEGVIPANFITPGQAHFMPSGEAAAEPAGYVSFCIRFADQCQISATDTIVLDSSTWKALNQVNASVNDAIWPEDDQRHYGRAEYWNIPTDGLGDCEDYALTKRKELTAAGYPISALRIAIVVTRQGERHAVLTVATDKGDLVLDNLHDEVKGWNSTEYRWIERQDPVHAMQWVSVDDNPVMLSAAAHPDGDSTGQISH